MAGMVVNLNGRLVDPALPHIDVLDRSFLYGDSIYEVVRTYQRKYFALDEHLDRLEQSAQMCQMTLSPSRSTMRQWLMEALDHHISTRPPHETHHEVYARIVVSRGSGPIGFTRKLLSGTNTVVLYVQNLPAPSDALLTKGLSLQISSRLRNDRRALDPAMKSGNYLNSLLAFLSAEAESFDDALLCDQHGFLTEGTTFNIFYIKNSIVVTSPLASGILEGITRRHVLRLSRELGLETREVFYKAAHLKSADEVFAASSIKEVFPVTQLDTTVLPRGSRTMQLREAFQSWARRAAH